MIRNRKMSIAVVAVLIISLLALAGCGTTTNPTNNSTQATTQKVLTVGTDPTFAPMEFMNSQNQPTGFDIDLMNAIAKDMGYKLNVQTSSFDGLIPSLQAGKYDAVIAAMTITPDRAKSVLFSNRYFMATQYIAFKKGTDIKSLADLKGKRLGVQNATTGETVLEKAGFNPKKYDDIQLAFTDLINGGVDAVVTDSSVVLYFIKQHPNLDVQYITGNFSKEYYGIAVKQGNTALQSKINASLQKLIANGQYNEIYKKWFKENAPKL